MKVWRIEHSVTEQAPYHTDWLDHWLKLDHNDSNHPGPTQDSKLAGVWKTMTEKQANKYKFGFKSEKDLNKWFNKSELKRLLKAGFDVKVYEVAKSKVIEGSKQVIFRS